MESGGKGKFAQMLKQKMHCNVSEIISMGIAADEKYFRL